jgi:hypothetical protein
MPIDLLEETKKPVDLLAGRDEQDDVVSLRQGQPESMWDKVTSFLGNPEKEKARATNALVFSEMLKISPSVAYEYHDEIAQQLREKTNTEKIFTEKQGMGAAVSSGIDTSILGMLRKQKVPKPFESVDQMERWVNGFVTMGLDLPFFIAGFKLGGGRFFCPSCRNKTSLD